MGRKKRHLVTLKPFCYYCDKEFNNELILHQHQKARHFNCIACKKRFSTAPALDTHVLQVHKKKLDRVPNAKAGRDTFDISIYGMDGVPIELINYKLAEKVALKKKKLLKEDEGNIKNSNDKITKKKAENDIKKILSNDLSGGFYHNPDSINLTLKQRQMKQMYTINPHQSNPFLSLGMSNVSFPGNLPMHLQNQLQNQILFHPQVPMNASNHPMMKLGLPIQNLPQRIVQLIQQSHYY
jgi:hypothetical protein